MKQDGHPVLLVFGLLHLKWKFDLSSKPLVFGLAHLVKENGLNYAQKRPFIATAFPGFKDLYQLAGVHANYGSIASSSRFTLSESLAQALESKAPLIQIATWNDYGEGTMIEPTRRHGFRHFEKLPRCGNPADLRLPAMLYQLRKRGSDAVKLAEAATLMFAPKFTEAETLPASVQRTRQTNHRRRLTPHHRAALTRGERHHCRAKPALQARCVCTGHKSTTLYEMDGFDHGKMPESAFPLLLKFVEDFSKC